MNAFQAIVKKGIQGEEDALESLNLSHVDPLLFEEHIDMDGPRIEAEFQNLAIIRVAATLMCQEGLAETAKFGMETLYYIKGFMGLTDLGYEMSQNDITKEMLTELENIRLFLVVWGEERRDYVFRDTYTTYILDKSSMVSRRTFFAPQFMLFYTLKKLCTSNLTTQRVN